MAYKKGGVPQISDMRIVLLGNREAGKSSSGNTILGREEFSTSGRTAECVKREGETAGRHITVVEAPGWWINSMVEQTPERDKREIALSVSLCPPGPHALLLLIGVYWPFTETDRRAVQEHMELLGERVWSHTIVLFTRGDWLGDTSIEQHIESGGEALQWVVEKCGNRYHVVNNEKSDGGQVTELLRKIEEMVAGNKGHFFDLNSKTLNELKEKKLEEERKVEERKKKVQKQREMIRTLRGGVPQISDMRIVLLGSRVTGKSSSGNTILGREVFSTSGRTAECVKREGETAGRHITVVEAPGWWSNSTVEQTPERDKREIALSVSLCPPGPHALLLVIRVDWSFPETDRRAVQGHMELLGERVWSHTIVLFTGGVWLGDTSIEQHIESGGEALQWVVEKCGNRYHVVNNKKSDGGQVTELLRKIEEMVVENKGHFVDLNTKTLKELKEKKLEEERKVEERKKKVQKQREMIRTLRGGVPQISDMRIVLLGSRVTGKSSSVNTILGREEFSTSGRTAECVKREGETAGRHITVVEAPGWWPDYTVEQTPERDKREIALSVSLCPPGPHALLLVIRVDESFPETDRRAVQGHMELLGERVWSHTIVLFTGGVWLGDTSIEQHIESGGEALQWVVEKCGNRYHVVNNTKSDGGQVTELLRKIEEMVAGNKGCHYGITRDQARSKNRPPDMSLGDSGCSSLGSKSEDGSKSSPKLTALEQRMTKCFLTRVPLVDKQAIKINHEHLIGGGAFGKVYHGSFQGSPAAIKMMSVEMNPSESLEAIIPLRLSHPHIVRMMAVSTMENQIIIAYEYIHGANLQEILWDTQCSIKLEELDKICVALEIAMAVEYTHGRNVIHQDIKPANILISQRTKTAYLTDWGLANMQDSQAQFGAGVAGELCGPHGAGTELYTAPELLLHNERCTTMSDMWSLGLTFLEMFTSCVPWALYNRAAITGVLLKQEPPHALAKLQPRHDDIVKPLVTYDPKSRMNAEDLVACLKSKVDLVKIYGYKW